MLISADLSLLRLEDKEIIIRKIISDDFATFCDYTRAEYFEDTVRGNDTLGIFINDEMAGAILSHNHCADEKLICSDEQGTCLGYSCRKDLRNRGIMTRALKLLSDSLLNQLDFIFLEIRKDNPASRRAARNAGFVEYDEKDDNVYLIKKKIS